MSVHPFSYRSLVGLLIGRQLISNIILNPRVKIYIWSGKSEKKIIAWNTFISFLSRDSARSCELQVLQNVYSTHPFHPEYIYSV